MPMVMNVDFDRNQTRVSLAFRAQRRFNQRMKRFAPLLLALLTPLLLGFSRKTEFTITFHSLATEVDPPKTMFPFDLNGKRVFFKIVPEVSQQNIVAFYPFPAEAGKGNGLTLQLDFRGRASLELISRTRHDEYLLAMVNATPVDFVILDQPVTDGIITIWQGVPDEIIKAMDKKYPRIKKSGAPSMTKDFEMLPTTKGEKKRNLKATQQAERDAAAAKKSGKKIPDAKSLDLRTGPVSPQIPLEGGSNPPLPVEQPPLPKP